MVAMDMVAATDTTARGLLMLRLSPLLMPNLAMVVVMEATAMVDTVVDMADTVATTARDLLMLRPSLAMVATDTAVAMDTTARGLLMLSPAMDTTAVDMVA